MLGSISGLAPTANNSGVAQGLGTGPYGAVAIPSGNSAMTALQSVLNWINAPLTEQWSPKFIVEVIGLILIGFIFWNMIIFHVRLAAEAI